MAYNIKVMKRQINTVLGLLGVLFLLSTYTPQGQPKDYFTEIALGNISGVSGDTKFGRNSDIDNTSTPEDIWEGGDIYTGHPTSFTPETVDLVSTDADDDSSGTGARTVQIKGLRSDTSSYYTFDTIILNGLTNVSTTTTWWRVNRIRVLTAGSSGANEGVITAFSTTTTSNVFAAVQAGYNQTTVAAYTVPAQKRMLLKRLRVSMARNNGSAGSGTVHLYARPNGGVYNSSKVFEVTTSSGTSIPYVVGEIFPAGTDLKGGVSFVSDNNTSVEMAFEYIIYPE